MRSRQKSAGIVIRRHRGLRGLGADSLKQSARRWFVSGRVQGVGFRAFVEEQARSIGLAGWVRNLDDGRVEAYAVGAPAQLDRLAARLHQGPPHSMVRGLEQLEAEMQQLSSFHTK